ncbi:hypothetical protein Tco_1066822 [Tanacetum coccineum]|uniref:Uncharacterized protein n=1 Tax=Tanacetum coccineum TaxID=301880 RepID=A0ABQ5HBQ0_9ASTR
MQNKLWDILRAKFEKSSASADPHRTDSFRKHNHDDHQGDDAPLAGGEKCKKIKTSKSSKSANGSLSKQSTKKPASKQHPQQQDWDAWVDTPVVNEDEVIPEDETPELINEFQNVDKDAEEYAYHLEQSQNCMENQIVWESWQEDLKRPKPNSLYGNTGKKRIVEVIRVNNEQQHVLDFMERVIVMRENDKPSSFSEANFKYLNKNDIEDMYYLFLNKKRVHDFQLGIESYPIKINLADPTLIFPGIEECEPFSIVDKLNMGFIYLNNKNKNMFMDLEELY